MLSCRILDTSQHASRRYQQLFEFQLPEDGTLTRWYRTGHVLKEDLAFDGYAPGSHALNVPGYEWWAVRTQDYRRRDAECRGSVDAVSAPKDPDQTFDRLFRLLTVRQRLHEGHECGIGRF